MPASLPVLVVGNAVLDLVLQVDHYPAEDEEMRASSRRADLGGNAANTARVLAGLGDAVTLLATLAPDDEAATLRHLLDAAGVDTRHLVTAPAGHTPVSYILVNDNGSRTIVHHRDLAELACADFQRLRLTRYGWVHFEGRNAEAVACMLTQLRGTGFSGGVSLEIEKPRPGIEALAAQVDLVLFSRAYAEAKGYADAPTLLGGVRALSHPALMTCTWGAAGAWAMTPDGHLHHAPAVVPPRVVDTVGAGDVFNAGLIDALAAGHSPAAALTQATRLAGRKVGQVGFAGLSRQVMLD